MRSVAPPRRRVIVFAPPGAFSLDVVGAYEVFAVANRLDWMQRTGKRWDQFPGRDAADELAYDVELVGARSGSIATMGGLSLVATRSLSRVTGSLDTLVVAGGEIPVMLRALADSPRLVGELRRVAGRARRVASICTGAFVLAALGLLDEKRATTHWAACEVLAKKFPKLRVENEPIYTQDGALYTSAGATTGMDLCLSLVREDLGRSVAQETARWLVLFMHRAPQQAQLSAQLSAQQAQREPLRDLQSWILEFPHADLSVAALAARVGMSERNFARAFRRETGKTPASYVEMVRVETAQRMLARPGSSLTEAAQAAGFGSVETLRRAFIRQRGRAPRRARASSS